MKAVPAWHTATPGLKCKPMTKAQRNLRTVELKGPAIAGAALAIAAVVAGLAFGGWMEKGTRILAVMAESGLAWCL